MCIGSSLPKHSLWLKTLCASVQRWTLGISCHPFQHVQKDYVTSAHSSEPQANKLPVKPGASEPPGQAVRTGVGTTATRTHLWEGLIVLFQVRLCCLSPGTDGHCLILIVVAGRAGVEEVGASCVMTWERGEMMFEECTLLQQNIR